MLALLLACAAPDEPVRFRTVDDLGVGDDTADTAGASPCPEGMALAGAVCIDVVEATVEGELGEMNQGFDWPDGSTTAVAIPRTGAIPTTQLSWYQAYAACQNAGKHLCTVDEWRAACSPEGARYPWGEEGAPEERCALVAPDNETPAPEGLSATGSHPDCAGPEGVFDMIGNAWEWVDPGTTAQGRPTTAKVGGAYYSGYGSGLCTVDPYVGHPPEFNGTIAARCCVAPAGMPSVTRR